MQYYSVNQYLKDTFGEKVYKISLNAGFSCPNRDGLLDTRGCIFCSAGGSGEFATIVTPQNIHAQIENAKSRILSKMPGKTSGKFIAYFQAYSNTYAPVPILKELFYSVIKRPDIVALSIATRPDCLPSDVLTLIDELNHIKPVWVELGLQTIHKSTSDYIRRGYDLNVYDFAVSSLKEIGIPQIITHVILGFPGETKEMMLDTVKHVISSGSNGIKLQLLHVLKGTDLEKDYSNGKFEVLSLSSYIDILKSCIEILPSDMVVHRITGDGDKRLLVAPLWSADKKHVLNEINKALTER